MEVGGGDGGGGDGLVERRWRGFRESRVRVSREELVEMMVLGKEPPHR